MSSITNLVVNGCSYMEGYARGNGHIDLAKQLNIPNAYSLAIGGSANSRILRTTLKHSYQTTKPTLYILGLTFVSRSEIPILKGDNEFEGRWCNPQNQEFSDRWDYFWSRKLSEEFVRIKLITEIHSLLDRTEDLMYNTLAMISSLKARGHQVLIYHLTKLCASATLLVEALHKLFHQSSHHKTRQTLYFSHLTHLTH